MKKIININLSGIVIPIEDFAYEQLQAYIDSLRRHFMNEEGRDEIINDIETRIAELMHQKIKKGAAAAITEADVNEIIATMGRPEELSVDEEPIPASTNYRQEQQYREEPRRDTGNAKGFFRNANDKFIGGVCSGLAAYLNIDPAIVRIIFAIITFGGFGSGILIYIILWILLPVRDDIDYAGKRLYRNPDNKMIGGVASGLAAYFNSTATTIRIVLVAPFVLNILLSPFGVFAVFPNLLVGSITGTFILVYIILWIVLPEARNNYEKMEMRGEPVDVNSIKKNVQQGIDTVEKKVKEWSKEVGEAANRMGKSGGYNTPSDDTAAAGLSPRPRSNNSIGHVLGVLFKSFFVFIFGTIALALFVALVSLFFGSLAWWPVNAYLWTSSTQQAYFWGTVVFFITVPLIAFMIWLIRKVTGSQRNGSFLGWTFAGLWTIGWISLILFVRSASDDLSHYETVNTPVAISNGTMNDKLTVAVPHSRLLYDGRFSWMNNEINGWNLDNDSLKLSTIRFKVVKSPDAAYHVQLNKYGFGSSKEDARNRAAATDYAVIWKGDSLLLENGFAISRNQKYRGQQIDVEIQVPVGKKVFFDHSVGRKLNVVSYRTMVKRNGMNWERKVEYDNYLSYLSGKEYQMEESGKLKIVGNQQEEVPVKKQKNEQENTVNRNNYRYDGNAPAKEEPVLEEQLEVEKRKLEEMQQKINELEKKVQQKKDTIVI